MTDQELLDYMRRLANLNEQAVDVIASMTVSLKIGIETETTLDTLTVTAQKYYKNLDKGRKQ